jgi:DnaK suppressor protein
MKPLAEFRARRTAIEAKLEELAAGFQDRSELTVENSADMLDNIQTAADRDVSVQRMNISTQILSDIREALSRLDKSEYGVCEDCEESIPPRRLDAIPWARVCVKCQETRDRRHGDGDDILSLAA